MGPLIVRVMRHVIFFQVLNLSADVLKHVPEPIDYESTYKLICDDMTPLNVVLLQEVPTYLQIISSEDSISVLADIRNYTNLHFQPANSKMEGYIHVS